MRRGRALLLAAMGALTLTGAAVAGEAPAAGKRISFVACPIARDTGPDTDVCFFTEHGGQQYTLANPYDWGVPQLRHRVLVEGTVTAAPGACGGLSFEGRASILAEVDDSCNTLVPFDGVHTGRATNVFNSGTPEQRARAEDLVRRAAADPSLSVTAVILDPPEPPPFQPPFTTRRQTVIYPFDSDRGAGPDMVELAELARYAQASAARIEVTGYRAASRLADGATMTERPDMAQRRATRIASIFEALGIAHEALVVKWQDRAAPGTGRDDWRNRKAEISVVPAQAQASAGTKAGGKP